MGSFTAEFYQILKELISILHNVFQKIKEVRTFLKFLRGQYYPATKAGKSTKKKRKKENKTEKKKLQANISHEYRPKNMSKILLDRIQVYIKRSIP